MLCMSSPISYTKDEIHIALQGLEVTGNTVFGPSGFEVLNKVTSRGFHISGLVVTHKTPGKAKFWNVLTDIILYSKNAEQCTRKIIRWFKENDWRMSPHCSPRRAVEAIRISASNPYCFLSDDRKFSHIQSILAEGKTLSTCRDLTIRSNLLEMAKRISKHSLVIDTVYISGNSKLPTKEKHLDKALELLGVHKDAYIFDSR